MKEIVLELIQSLEAEKREKKIVPDHVTGLNIAQALKTSFRQLIDEGRVEAGNTISDYWLKSV